MGNLTREHLIDAVAAGFTDSQIAESLGVTPSAVAQAIEKYDIKNLAETKAKASKFSTIDDALNKAEEILALKLVQSVQMMEDPLKIARVLQTVNGAKRRSLDEGATQTPQTQIAILNLPQRQIVNVITNANNEVVEIDGRPMLTINPAVLMQRIKETKDLEHKPAAGGKDGITPEQIRQML